MLGRKKPEETNQPTPPQQTRSATAASTNWSPPTARSEVPMRGEAMTRGETSREAPARETPTRGEPSRGHMQIGKSVHIKGELIANEEMTIEGAVEGNIVIDNHQLTVGTNGRITASVRVKSIVVMGKVVGNITAEDKVEVRNGGSVEGDIRGPRVILADGAVFKGNVDMVVPAGSGPRTPKGDKATPAPADADTGPATAAVDDMPALFSPSLDEAVNADAGDGQRRSGRLAERT